MNDYLEKFTSSSTYINSTWKKHMDQGELLNTDYPTQPLKPRERIIIYNKEKSLVKLGEILGLSPERVRQIKFKACMKLLYMKIHDIDSFNKLVHEIQCNSR